MTHGKNSTSIGMVTAVSSFLIWGHLPLFWYLLRGQAAFEILYHRSLWSLIFLTLLLFVLGRSRYLIVMLSSPKVWLHTAASALAIGSNWFLYIWAVNAGHVVETSLGYYLNPLVNVAFGLLFLKERLTRLQGLALALAALAVIFLAAGLNSVPWLVLSLTLTFSTYALLKKFLNIDSLARLWLETLVLMLFLGAYNVWQGLNYEASFFQAEVFKQTLLILSGVVTATPLLLYSIALKNLKLSTLGFMQYLSPSIQLFIGVYVFKEPFQLNHFWALLLIWAAILLYSLEGLGRIRRRVKELQTLE